MIVWGRTAFRVVPGHFRLVRGVARVDGELGIKIIGVGVELVGDVAAEGEHRKPAADEAVGGSAGTVEIDVADAFGESFQANESGDGGGDAIERGKSLGVRGGGEHGHQVNDAHGGESLRPVGSSTRYNDVEG